MTGRAYMGEVLIKVWVKSIAQTSECTKREFEKTSRVDTNSRKPTKKCAMKMKVVIIITSNDNLKPSTAILEQSPTGLIPGL